MQKQHSIASTTTKPSESSHSHAPPHVPPKPTGLQQAPKPFALQHASTSAAAMAAFNHAAPPRFRNNQFNLEPNFSVRSRVSQPGSTRNAPRERPMIHGSLLPPSGLPRSQSPQQLTSLSMNDLDLIEEMPDIGSADLKTRPPTSTEEYKQPRLYRKRPRFHHPPGNGVGGGTRRRLQDSTVLYNMPNRRVLSLECLSPPNKQTDSPFFDISYLDTGDLCLVKQGGDGRCIFVTDFL